MANIDLNRLAVDREYWDSVAAKSANFAVCSHEKFIGWQQYEFGDEKELNYRLIPRPTEQEWDGEGLPPVGCECEAYIGHRSLWIKGRVFHITALGVCFVEFLDGNWIASRKPEDFRPIRTPEQREAEELYNDAQKADLVNFTENMATAIIEAGWRKTK